MMLAESQRFIFAGKAAGSHREAIVGFGEVVDALAQGFARCGVEPFYAGAFVSRRGVRSMCSAYRFTSPAAPQLLPRTENADDAVTLDAHEARSDSSA